MIRFLVPSFLFALSLIAVPVLIHLFNFRRFKKVYFTNVRFLQELKEETTRVSKLKHLLVLLARILAVIFLVLAFAQPIIPVSIGGTVRGAHVVSIYIDNSFSMESITREGTLLDVAKKKAKEIALAFPPTTRFQLLTNDFEAVHQRLISRDEFLDESDHVKISPVSRNLSDVVVRQKEALHQATENSQASFLISDFQVSTSDIANIKADSSLQLNVVALPVQHTSNIYIDSCWLSSPVVQLNRPVTLTVKLRNSGDKEVENVPIRLLINGAQRAVASNAIGAGQSVETNLSFTITTPGWQQAEIKIADHPITFDDNYFLAFNVREQLNVLSIDGHSGSPYLKALFGNDPYFKFSSVGVSQVDYSKLNVQDVIIINEVADFSSGLNAEISKYVERGGSIIWFPDSEANIISYNNFLTGDAFGAAVNNIDKVERIDLQNPVFTDVFENKNNANDKINYPVTTKHFPLSHNGAGRLTLMQLQGGDPFLSQYNRAKGKIYLFSVPLTPGFSNLARHAMVVPLLYKMALLSTRQPEIQYTLGKNAPISLEKESIGTDEIFHLINAAGNIDIIPAHRVLPEGIQVNVGDQIPVAGNYDLKKGKDIPAVIAFNYDRKESELKYWSIDQISQLSNGAHISGLQIFKANVNDLTKTLHQQAEGIPLWKYCILLTLIFLLAEIVLLRFWKTTS